MVKPSDETRAEDLLLRVDEMRGRVCGACGAKLCGHALLLDVIAGFQGDPTCPACLAAALGRPRDFVTTRVREFVDHRDCTRAAWQQISRDEPGCELARAGELSSSRSAPIPPTETRTPPVPIGATWDAGDLGCGDLVLELRNRMKTLPPGAVLHLVARDPGALADIPAWCKLTGHSLIEARHPHYHLRRKDD
jgi:tRNA 2-thiouridine synthesizing protein A